MKNRTHLYKTYHYFRDIFQTGLHSLLFISGKLIFSLIFTITLLMFFFVVSEKTSAKNSIFNSDKKTQIINTPHNKLTQAFKLNKDVIYSDTLNKSAINFYYISSPKTDYTLYIKCPGETISQKYIQIFDSTYKELDYKLQKKSSYLCINLATPLSDISDKTCIYISIGSISTVNNKIYILYTKTETSKTKSSTSNKPKTGDKIKKTQTNKTTSKKHNNIKPQTAVGNSKKDTAANSKPKTNKATQNKTTHTKPVKINKRKNKTTRTKPVKVNKRKNKKLKTNTKKYAAKKNNKKLTPKLQGISLSKHYVLLKKRNSLQLNFTTQPANLHGCKYIWTTTNPKVASVSSGKITAKSTGLAVVKLKIIHNQIVKTSTCTVRVTL